MIQTVTKKIQRKRTKNMENQRKKTRMAKKRTKRRSPKTMIKVKNGTEKNPV